MTTTNPKHKKWLILLAVLLLCALCWYLFQIAIPTLRLLDTFDLPPQTLFSLRYYENWRDWLKYGDSFELVVARVPSRRWVPPESWTKETATITQIEQKNGVDDLLSLLQSRLKSLPATFDDWFFHEVNRALDVDTWNQWIGLYNTDGTLILYRGYHLYNSFRHTVPEESITCP